MEPNLDTLLLVPPQFSKALSPRDIFLQTLLVRVLNDRFEELRALGEHLVLELLLLLEAHLIEALNYSGHVPLREVVLEVSPVVEGRVVKYLQLSLQHALAGLLDLLLLPGGRLDDALDLELVALERAFLNSRLRGHHDVQKVLVRLLLVVRLTFVQSPVYRIVYARPDARLIAGA